MNIFFYWDNPANFPNAYSNNIKTAEAIHYDANIELIDAEKAKRICKEFHTETGIFIDLDIINIPAAKSDIVRLMALYLYGGWYLDCDLQIKRHLAYLSNNQDFVMFHRKDKFGGYWHTNMAFYLTKKHELALDVLKFIDRCFQTETLMYDVWSCTGPGAITAYTNLYGITKDNTLDFNEYFSGTGCVFKSIDSNTGTSWKYQQAFGILEGMPYNQFAMPKDPKHCNRLIGFLKNRKDKDIILMLKSHGELFITNKQFSNYVEELVSVGNEDLKSAAASLIQKLSLP